MTTIGWIILSAAISYGLSFWVYEALDRRRQRRWAAERADGCRKAAEVWERRIPLDSTGTAERFAKEWREREARWKARS